MARKKKTFQEKINEWGEVNPPNTEYSFVDFLNIDEIDAAIMLLVDMRTRHPDITKENTDEIINHFVGRFKNLAPYRQWKCINPRKFEADSIRRFLDGRVSAYREFTKWRRR